MARTLEDVSHLFLSEEEAVSGMPDSLPDGSGWQSEKMNDRLKRAVADLTLDNLILKEASGRLERLERENELLKRAVADLTLDNLLLKEAAKGHR